MIIHYKNILIQILKRIKQMGYKKALVYFIDVLGTKDRDFNDNLKIASVFRNEMNNIQLRHRKTSFVDRCVFSFSDCAYIVYALKDEFQNDENYKNRFIYQSLYNTTQTISTFLAEGFLCRGGIVYGDVYYDLTQNIIFGPAVNYAYKLESEIAIYPNIILEDKLAQEVLSFDQSIKIQNPLASLTNGQIILHNDITNRYYLNYLNYLCDVSCAELGTESYSFERLYEKAIAISNNEIIKNSNIENVVKKHQWQIKYLNEIKQYRDSGIEIDPISLLNL